MRNFSITGKITENENLDVEDINFIDRIKGWNACGWIPTIWIDSDNAEKLEKYDETIRRLKRCTKIFFDLKDVRELEYIKNYKKFFDKLPIYARVDMSRIFAMLAGDGLGGIR